MIADEQIDAEQYDEAEQTLAKVATINPQHPRAAAYQAVLAHLRNQPDKEKSHRAAALQALADESRGRSPHRPQALAEVSLRRRASSISGRR